MAKRNIRLKDGREVILRLLMSGDREKLLEMTASLSRDALMWSNPPYDEAKIDRWMSGAEVGLSIVATSEDRIVGVAAIHQFTRPRERGLGGLMIYIHQDFHCVGLGTAMTSSLLELAKAKRLHRIGLEVVADNDAGVRLYKKLGFRVEGILKDAYYGEDERYHDMLVMGMLLAIA